MAKKYKYFQLIFTLIVLFFLVVPSVLALEIEYPVILGFDINKDALKGTLTLTLYIFYWFMFLIVSAAGIGVISIIISGFQILLNFGRPEAINAAKKRILDVIVGIVLLMTSFLILRTINPELITPSASSITYLQPGIYIATPVPKDDLHPDGYSYKTALTSYKDTSSIPSGSYLTYKCIPPDKTLRVWKYNKPNFIIDSNVNGSGNVNTIDLPCNSIEEIPLDGIESFFWNYKSVGVYFYSKPNCSGISTCSDDFGCAMTNDGGIEYFDSEIQNTDGSLPDKQIVRSVEIVSGTPETQKYGVILSAFKGGECTQPFINIKDSLSVLGDKQKCTAKGNSGICCNIPLTFDGFELLELNPSYAYIINPSSYYPTRGVILQSENYQMELEKLDIGHWYSYKGQDPEFPSVDELFRETLARKIYTGKSQKEIDELKECQTDDPNFPCLKNVLPKEEYYTVLYSRNILNDVGDTCKVFGGSNGNDNRGPTSIENLKQYGDLISNNDDIFRIDIIPHAK